MSSKKEARAQHAFGQVPTEIREDLHQAIWWAVATLTQHEGAGHIFQVHPVGVQQVMCTFSKPEWSGEHQGRHMPTGSEAVVMAVCEYLNGA